MFQLLITSNNEKIIIEEITNLYWNEGFLVNTHHIPKRIFETSTPTGQLEEDYFMDTFKKSKKYYGIK
jgi:hypothetical protein